MRPAPADRRPRLTLFDLDHTLLPLDSDYEWGQFTTRIGWCDAHDFARRNAAFYAQYQAGTLDVHDYVRFATEALRQRSPHEAHAARARFMREVIAPALRPQAQALVQRHRAAGDTLLIVTATNEFVTTPIAQAFGLEPAALLALQLARQADGWYSGAIEGVPTLRAGKVLRVEQWLAARQLGWGDVASRFYSDSMNDLALLERVDQPVATNPEPRLRALAAERGWRILDLFGAAPGAQAATAAPAAAAAHDPGGAANPGNPYPQGLGSGQTDAARCAAPAPDTTAPRPRARPIADRRP